MSKMTSVKPCIVTIEITYIKHISETCVIPCNLTSVAFSIVKSCTTVTPNYNIWDTRSTEICDTL